MQISVRSHSRLQELVHGVAEDTWACEIQGTLDLPGKALPDHVQDVQQDRVTRCRHDEPLLKLLRPPELDLCALPLWEAMPKLVASEDIPIGLPQDRTD